MQHQVVRVAVQFLEAQSRRVAVVYLVHGRGQRRERRVGRRRVHLGIGTEGLYCEFTRIVVVVVVAVGVGVVGGWHVVVVVVVGAAPAGAAASMVGHGGRGGRGDRDGGDMIGPVDYWIGPVDYVVIVKHSLREGRLEELVNYPDFFRESSVSCYLLCSSRFNVLFFEESTIAPFCPLKALSGCGGKHPLPPVRERTAK